MRSRTELSHEISVAVAEAEDIDPTDLRSPLYRAIDGDALDALFRRSSGRVAFEYGGYEVTVTSDGDVSLSPTGEV